MPPPPKSTAKSTYSTQSSTRSRSRFKDSQSHNKIAHLSTRRKTSTHSSPNTSQTRQRPRSYEQPPVPKKGAPRQRSKHEYWEPEPLPWFTSKTPQNPRDDKDCLLFLSELWAFLQEVETRGIVKGQLHPDIDRFLADYGNVLYTAGECCAIVLT